MTISKSPNLQISKSSNGAAIIMMLYVLSIVTALATFFIADQIHNKRMVFDSKDSALALEGANLGLAYVVNYLGDPSKAGGHWANSVAVSDGTGNPVCGFVTIPYLGNNLIISAVAAGADPANPALIDTSYTFSIDNPVLISTVEKKYASISGTLTFAYNPALTLGGTCATLTSNNPDALVSVSADVRADVTDAARGAMFASREIKWSGKRNLNLALVYQSWSAWDVPGAKYPNRTQSTNKAAFIGSGYTANAGLASFSVTDANYDFSVSNTESPYGSDQSGIINVKSDGSGLPPADLNSWVMTYGGVNNNGGVLDGKIMPNTNAAVPLPMGQGWGKTDGAGPNTAAAMASAFGAAADDSACASGIKTVFVASSQDVGSDGKGYGVEFQSGYGKPGFAVVDINLNDPNHPGKVTITQSGYYSGKVLYQETFDPTGLQYRTIYVQGGNVRVHGNLQAAGLTVAANQGEALYSSGGLVTSVAGPDGAAIRLNDSSNPCLAPNQVQGKTFAVSSAQRVTGNAAGPASTGANYWVPNSGFPSSCASSPAACASLPQSSDPNCSNCLYDSLYHGSNYDPVTNPVILGAHVDNVNGEVLVPISSDRSSGNFKQDSSGNWAMTCSSASCDSTLNGAMYAPPPQFNGDGTFTNGTGNTISKPTSVTLYNSSGQSIGTRLMWPYPGSDNAGAFQNDISQADVFYLRQYEYSEGNITIAGDTTGNSLGLFAQNYVLINDMAANAKAGSPNPTTEVRAYVASGNHTMQWEGNTNSADSVYKNDPLMNGDYAVTNGQYNDAGKTKYTISYFDSTGQHPVQAESWGISSSSFISNAGNWASPWTFDFKGRIYAPYQDILSSVPGNGSVFGYTGERVNLDRYTAGTPPMFPAWTWTDFQNLGITLIYPTTYYQDMGAPHS